MTTESINNEDVITDKDINDETIDFVRATQKTIIQKLMSNGDIPHDKSGLEALTQNLSNMASNAIALKKMKSEDATAKNNTMIAAAIADLLKDPKSKDFDRSDTITVRTTYQLAPKEVSVIPGELDTGSEQITYSQIMV